jgi:radical SAM superfamily enzyme YgiQ (UPF0313 family)
MKKKILLIHPETPATYWSFKYILKILGRRAAFPPLGLMTVAALIPDNYEVKLVDMNTSPLEERDIVNADLVFLSAMIIQKESFELVAARCAGLGKTVIAGGPYPTSLYKNIEGVDHFVLGEAELTLPHFLRDYENGKPRKIYQSKDKPDLSTSPIPRFDLVKHGNYTTMSLQYSRGCPFNCEFCDIIEMFGRVPRTKDPVQFISEMDALYKTGYRGPLFIVDDNFIGNKNRVKSLLPAVAAWQKKKKYPFMIFTEASINLASDEELMDLMVDAGFNKVFLGIETPDEKSLRQSQKEQNLRLGLLDAVAKIQGKGMEVTAGFILGFDSDPPDIFDIQIDFIRRSGIPMAMVGLLTVLPNTQLYRRLESENRNLKQTSGNNTHDLQLNFAPVMDAEVLVKGYKKVISHIYRPTEYFNRCLIMMKTMPEGRFYAGAVTPRMLLLAVRIFLFSFVRQIFTSYCIQYLEYLAAALKIRIGLFPKAIKMAMFGYHFYKITQEIIAVADFSASIEKISRGLRSRIENIRFNRIEDIIHDLLSLDVSVLERRLIMKIQKRYKTFHQDFRSHIEEPMRRLGDDFKIYTEIVAESLRKKFESGMPNLKAARELNRYSQKIKNKLKRKYRYINRDFRAHFGGLFDFFGARIDTLVHDFESRHNAQRQDAGR